jgi:hypothetical protein
VNNIKSIITLGNLVMGFGFGFFFFFTGLLLLLDYPFKWSAF